MKEQCIPNWNALATLDSETHSYFAAEMWAAVVRNCYSTVLNKHVDNQEIVSRFLLICDNSPQTKLAWTCWLASVCYDREDGPIKPEEVMRFFTHLAMKEEANIIKQHHS